MDIEQRLEDLALALGRRFAEETARLREGFTDLEAHRANALLDVERALGALAAKMAEIKDGRDGAPGPEGPPGKDAEIFAPDEVAGMIAAATKMLAALPSLPAAASGISLALPAIEIPAPVVQFQVPKQRRLKTVITGHDANGRITGMEQVEVEDE